MSETQAAESLRPEMVCQGLMDHFIVKNSYKYAKCQAHLFF